MARDKFVWKMFLDFVVLACIGFPLLALMLWVEPYHRGYDPGDHSLYLPYKSETVPVVWLAIAGFALNVFTIVTVEISHGKQGDNVGDKFLCGKLVPGWVWQAYTAIGIFTFGAACQQLTVNFTKYVIGRLRPHFFDVCQPIPVVGSELNTLGYIQDYMCAVNNNNLELLLDMRLSFPSAHASFSMYSALFFMFYIQVKGKWRGSKLLRHGIQYAVLMAAWWVGLSRVVDHMHHWSDVATGFVVGAVYAAIVFVYILKPKKYGLPVSWPDQEPQHPPNILPRVVLQ